MNSDWYQKSVNALTLAGKGERTVEAYTRALRMLVQFHHGKAPCDISQSELEAYFLHRRNRDHWSPNTLRICYCGIRFFFVSVLGRDWRLFQYLRARAESRLPAVLSREEVHSILSCVRTPHNRAFLSQGFNVKLAAPIEVPKAQPLRCPHCGAKLVYRRTMLPHEQMRQRIAQSFARPGAPAMIQALNAGA